MLGNATSRDSFSLTAGPFRSLSQPHPSHPIPSHTIPYHTRLYPPPLQAAVHLLHRRSLTLPTLTFADGSTTLASPPLVRDLEAKERAAAVGLAVPISNPDPVNPAHSVFQVESTAGGALSSVTHFNELNYRDTFNISRTIGTYLYIDMNYRDTGHI